MVGNRDFFCVYDYGMGGIWVIIVAGAAKEISQKYPFLKVFENRPSFFSDEMYESTTTLFGRFDIHQEPPQSFKIIFSEHLETDDR